MPEGAGAAGAIGRATGGAARPVEYLGRLGVGPSGRKNVASCTRTPRGLGPPSSELAEELPCRPALARLVLLVTFLDGARHGRVLELEAPHRATLRAWRVDHGALPRGPGGAGAGAAWRSRTHLAWFRAGRQQPACQRLVLRPGHRRGRGGTCARAHARTTPEDQTRSSTAPWSRRLGGEPARVAPRRCPARAGSESSERGCHELVLSTREGTSEAQSP